MTPDCTCKTCPNAMPKLYMGTYGEYFDCALGYSAHKDFGCIRHPNWLKVIRPRTKIKIS